MTPQEKHIVRIPRYFYDDCKWETDELNPKTASDLYPFDYVDDREEGFEYPTVPVALKETKQHVWIDLHDKHTPFLLSEALRFSTAVGGRLKDYVGSCVFDRSPIINLSGLVRSAVATYKVLLHPTAKEEAR